MKKHLIALFALLALSVQAAKAMPTGWYNLNQTWRDGSFTGQIYYDSSLTYKIGQVNGVLTDIAETTTIKTVHNVVNNNNGDWAFLDNASPVGTNNYNAGFYITLQDLGNSFALASNAVGNNALYDWSSNFQFYSTSQLQGSPLISSSITAVNAVPEPASLALFALGLFGFAAVRRRQR